MAGTSDGHCAYAKGKRIGMQETMKGDARAVPITISAAHPLN